MKNLLIVLSTLIIVGCSSTGGHSAPRGQTAEVVGTVISSDRAPLVCAEDRSNKTNSLVTTIVGGVIGNQFGSGSGRKAATATGAALGYGYAHNKNKNTSTRHDCRGDGWVSTIQYINPLNGQLEYSDIKTNQGLRQGERIRTNVRAYP